MCALLVSCSETSSVPADDKLFTGLRTTVYENYTPSDHFSAVKEEVEAALATAPNGSFMGSPYIRMPWPSYRLCIYNWFSSAERGPGKWLCKTFGKAPVLLSSVNPSLHAQVTRELLRSRGYFGGYVNYDVLTNDSTKRAKVKYTVNLGPLTTSTPLPTTTSPRQRLILSIPHARRQW